MVPHRWNGRLGLLALIGIILYVMSNAYYVKTHPETAEQAESGQTDTVSQEKALQAAEQFLKKEFNFGSDAVTLEASFQSDKRASGYIVSENIQKDYEAGVGKTAPLNYWLVVARSESGIAEYSVRISMKEEKVVGWAKLHPARETVKNGLTVAKDALSRMGFDLNDYAVQAQKDGSENFFPFVSQSQHASQASLVLTVEVSGDKAVAVRPSLQIPEEFIASMTHQEDLAHTMTMASLVSLVLFGVAALFYAIRYRKDILFRRGWLLAAIVAALYLMSNLNVTDAYLNATGNGPAEVGSGAWIGFLLFVAGLSLLLSLCIWLCLLSGDQLWRSRGVHLWPAMREEHFGEDAFYGMGRGYLICFFILGLQQVLFLIADQSFNAYAISDPSISTLNLKWPFLFPLSAWIAALMEESIYRVFGISVLRKLLRSNFAAILVSGFIWGLGHTGYTIYPSYTRLFEVTVLGIVFGYVFLKYGFITAVFTHATMDSLLMGLSLMTENPSAVNIWGGLFYMALPAIIGYSLRAIHPRIHLRYRSSS